MQIIFAVRDQVAAQAAAILQIQTQIATMQAQSAQVSQQVHAKLLDTQNVSVKVEKIMESLQELQAHQVQLELAQLQQDHLPKPMRDAEIQTLWCNATNSMDWVGTHTRNGADSLGEEMISWEESHAEVMTSEDELQEFEEDVETCGIDVDKRANQDCFGQTRLHRAAQAGDLRTCLRLLDDKGFVDTDAQDHCGCTALHRAGLFGHAETCRVLLSHPRFGAADVQDKYGRTALHSAALSGHASACKEILEHPRFNAADLEDHSGSTALWLSEVWDRTAAANVLRRPRVING